jgi:hypothetical protein
VFKRGFRVPVKFADSLAAGGPSIREFASNTQVTVRAIDQLHTEWLAQRQDGKVPVVTTTRYQEIPSGKGSVNYRPLFQIIRWIDRPADLQPNKAPSQPSGPQPSGPPAHVVDPIGEPEVFDEDPEDASFT